MYQRVGFAVESDESTQCLIAAPLVFSEKQIWELSTQIEPKDSQEKKKPQKK
jgi:hypothetical protein